MKFSPEIDTKVPLVVLDVDPKPVFYVGPATRENPLSQVRTKLLGNVYFNNRKIKWNRITLRFTGKAGLNITAPSSSLPPDVVSSTSDLQEAITSKTHLATTVTLCQVEKELIYNNERVIDFGLHLPPYLPPSIKTEHAFVEYNLTLICTSSGAFGKKQKIEKPVTVCRHYLPSPSSLIPSVEYNGVREWFEWSAEVPKATAIEAGEVVIALRWNIEKEFVEVDRIEMAIEELEIYRFSTKIGGVHNLTPIVTQFPQTAYHPPSFSNDSEIHFVRTPIPLIISKKVPTVIRTHHFDPFLEISHRIRLTIHFSKSSTSNNIKPLSLDFPIIITDFPPNTTAEYFVDHLLSPIQSPSSNTIVSPIPTGTIQPGGDEAPSMDIYLPEYTPRYERSVITSYN